MSDASRPLKVCFYCDHWPSLGAMHGPARYVQLLAGGLIERGCAVHVVTAHEGPPIDFAEGGYLVHARPARPLRVISRFQPGVGESRDIARAIGAIDMDEHFDVVEFTNVEGAGFWYSRFGRAPAVIRVHTTAYDAARLGLGNVRLERGYARLERWTAGRADALVTHTLQHRDRIADDYGVEPDRIAVVPHGFVLPRAGDSPHTRVARVISVGAASGRKGVDAFLQVAERLHARFPEVRFTWAGKDSPTAPGGATWAAYARERYPTLSGHLDFIGKTTDEELARLYQESACYLSTSLYESFGMTIVEAMLARLPVVAPATAAFTELIPNAETGQLYDPGHVDAAADAVARVLHEPGLAERVSTAAYAHASREYSVDTMTTRMMAIYRSLVR